MVKLHPIYFSDRNHPEQALVNAAKSWTLSSASVAQTAEAQRLISYGRLKTSWSPIRRHRQRS